MSIRFIDPENMGLDTKMTWLGQIVKELGYFKGFLPILEAILKITPFEWSNFGKLLVCY